MRRPPECGHGDSCCECESTCSLLLVFELGWRDAASTWNPRRASVLSWPGWCRERGYGGPAWAKRVPSPDAQTPARSKMTLDRLIARRKVALRE